MKSFYIQMVGVCKQMAGSASRTRVGKTAEVLHGAAWHLQFRRFQHHQHHEKPCTSPPQPQPCRHGYRPRASHSLSSPYRQGHPPRHQLPRSPCPRSSDVHRFFRRSPTTRAPITRRFGAVAVRRQERERREEEVRRVNMRTERCPRASREDKRRSGSRIQRGEGESTTRTCNPNQDQTDGADIMPDSRWKCRPSTSTGYNRGSTRAASIPPSPSQ
jgi:hypothetical protein